MVLEFLHPQPGAQIRVIGAGLPRTGTNSFCAALAVLLGGPPYHAGVQWGSGTQTDETHILTMIEVAKKFPYKTAEERSRTLHKLETLLDGYVVATDPPLSMLVPELMELYPDATVICTIRDRDAWVQSILGIIKTTRARLAGFLYFWIPSVRYLPAFAAAQSNLFWHRFGMKMESAETCVATWERHRAWLEETVPKEKLFYADVKDGWAPLCKALDRPIPDVPFPRLNEKKAFDEHFKKLAVMGLMRWAMFAAALAVIAALLYSWGMLGVMR